MQNQYDVIIIGAGNGGLAAAATTTDAGLSTLVLEKNLMPGGCATGFRRGRFEFEPSLHELCSVGTAENPGEVYTRFKGWGADIDWQYDPYLFRVIAAGPDGYDVRLRAGRENFLEDMETLVPGCRPSVEAFLALSEKTQAATSYIESKGGRYNILTMLTRHGEFLRAASHSVESVQKAYGMTEKARNLLNTYWCYLGVPTDELNAVHYASMLEAYVKDGAVMPRKRSHQLSMSLEACIRSRGGEIWYNSEVCRLLYDKETGACNGVVLRDGRELHARAVIANVMPDAVYAMSEPHHVPARERKLRRARKLGLSFYALYLGLDVPADELGITDYTTFIMTDPNPRKQFDQRAQGGMFTVNCLNVAIPDASPAGTSMLYFTIPVFGEELPEDVSASDPAAYRRFKNTLADEYITRCEQALGVSIRGHVEEISVATPVTFARYLGTPDGAVYGYHLSKWDDMVMRMGTYKEDFTVPGLYYCGGHDYRGDGYNTTYSSGISTAERVIRCLAGFDDKKSRRKEIPKV